MFNVGLQLRRIRKKTNLTLDQLAASSGVDRGTISRIELGHVSPRIDTISFLCEAMGTNLALFFDGEGEQPEARGTTPEPPADPPETAGADGFQASARMPRADPEGYWPVPSSFWQGLLE